MDLNLVILCGRLVAPPDHHNTDSGSTMVRFLLAVRSETPRHRLDVLPVILWDPPPDSFDVDVGSTIWVAGRIQRRFWDDDSQRRSRLVLVADHIDTHRLEGSPV